MESSTNQKVAIVTGSSTGIGYETSIALARNGFLTYATMRNLNKSENIKSLAILCGTRVRILKSKDIQEQMEKLSELKNEHEVLGSK